jgi:predicted nucleic acid-binding protein
MLVLDASSIIHAWDNYPIEQFPPLWSWLGEQVNSGQLTIPVTALDEVTAKTPECATWLKNNGIEVLQITDAILTDALRIRNLLGIVDDQYGSGVGENDLFIIATARAHGVALVTDEARQPILPNARRNYRIPAVCVMPQVATKSMSFVEFIKDSKIVFG